jgi:hypothetical protein
MLKQLTLLGAILVSLAIAAAMLLVFGVYYWLAGVVGTPDDWRGTVALALTAAGARVGVGAAK